MKKLFIKLSLLIVLVVLSTLVVWKVFFPTTDTATVFKFSTSWGPSFCQTTERGREAIYCDKLAPTDFLATHFSIHGLWTFPTDVNYCGVSADLVDADTHGRWYELPHVNLSAPLRAQLDQYTLGVEEDYLDRHEWIKHGTCSALSPEDYFRTSVTLQEQFLGIADGFSPAFSDFIKSNIGKSVTREQICNALKQSLGPIPNTAFNFISRTHQGSEVLDEIWIGLYVADKMHPQMSLKSIAPFPDATTGQSCDDVSYLILAQKPSK